MSTRTSQHAPGQGAADGRRAPRRAADAAAHSLRVGKLFGIPLQVHWTFLLLLGLIVFADWSSGAGAIVGGLLWVVALFASVVVHELAHSLLARRRGANVLGILLLPIGGMSRMERLPSAPADEVAIAAVGPAASLLLGGLLLAVGVLIGSTVWPPALVAGSWWARLGWLNLLLGVFNLLPALPMDGGRVLRGTLARRLSRLSATRIAASVARLLALGLIVAGVFYDFWLVLIGIFVLLGASREEAMARAEERSKHQPSWWWGTPPGYPPGPHQPGEPPYDPSHPGVWLPPRPQTLPPAPRNDWPPPWGQQPSPRSAIDVAVERRGPDPGTGEPGGEGVGEHH